MFCCVEVFAALFAAGDAVVLAVVVLSTAVLTFVTIAVFAASVVTAVFVFADCSGEIAGLASGDASEAGAVVVSKTERFPVKAGCESKNAESIKVAAAPIVIFDKILSVPRGPKAVLETLLVKSAPASDFPGCNKTVAIKVTQDKINNT